MHTAPAELIGPDFLQRLSEQQLANGFENDYATLQANARAWNAERAAAMELRHTHAQQERSLRAMREQLQTLGNTAHAAVQA